MNQGCWKVNDDDEGVFYKHDRHHKFSHELWNEMYKSKSTGSKGQIPDDDSNCHETQPKQSIFIDLEDEEQREDSRDYSLWSDLPDLLLEEIFSYLTIRERYYASLVCRNWYRAFYLPRVWSEFTLEDNTLTRSRFNYYSGWQYVLDHVRAQNCLAKVGRNFKKLTIEPMLNFYNLYEFMNMISWYLEQRKAAENVELGICSNIDALKFTFPCNMTTKDDEAEETRLFGTGGKILASLRHLMSNLKKLQRLQLIDLMLEPFEAQYLLDEVCENACLTLRTLYVINATRVQYQLLHVGVFLNLQILVISPQNLGDEIVELLSHTNLQHLHILQNKFTPSEEIHICPVSPTTWRTCRKNNPYLHVHLTLESTKDVGVSLIWQEFAPVRTILYDSPYISPTIGEFDQTIDFYRHDLQVYGHKNILSDHVLKKFDSRNDGNFVMLTRKCKYLRTLVITEPISAATVLLVAYTGKNLNWLYVRGDAVILHCDWPRNPEWSDEFYEWLKINSESYRSLEKEISQILGYRWRLLSDDDFLKIDINLYCE